MSLISSRAKFTISSFPFRHIVIEDIFERDLALDLESEFGRLILKGEAIGKVGEVHDAKYDAINFAPVLSHLEQTALGNLADQEIKSLVSNLLSIRLDENLMLGMHKHVSPSKPGWPHTDFAVVSFPSIPVNFNGSRVFDGRAQCNYCDDTLGRQPESIKTARAIACLYYTANSQWQAGNGGETGLYAKLGTQLVSKVPPKNNSLLAFEISPISYHAYLGSKAVDRCSFIWWYHSSPRYLFDRNREAVLFKQKYSADPWDRWTGDDEEKFPVEFS